jgi:divalent metal cation (Fe/Co/Zn/Cd) transporter
VPAALHHEQRRLGSIRSESRTSSVATLGLGANALAGWWWADPLTALAIAAVALKEGRESWRGEGCCDAC